MELATTSTNGIESVLGSIVSGVPVTTILAVLLAVVLAIIVWMRTRSTHMLMSRLWMLFNGKSECKNDQVKKLLDSQSSLLQFRFLTGLHVRTLQHINLLDSWTRSNNEDIGDIAACGHYFDLEKPNLKEDSKLPSTYFQFGVGAAVVALSMTIFGFLGGAVLDRAILQLRNSGTFFTLNKDYAKPISSSAGFKLAKCSDSHVEISTISGFSVSDVDTICKTFYANGVEEYVNSTVYFQRVVFVSSSLFSTYFCGALFALLLQGTAAHNMKRRLKKNLNKDPIVLSAP